MGEHKFDGYRVDKNWELEKWKKIGVLAIQKVAKTGKIGKVTPVAGNIDYVRYISKLKREDAWNDTRFKVNKH